MTPFVGTYHVTSYCNLNCSYCEDFGAHRNREFKQGILDLDGAKNVLRMMRTGAENLILTGGEALLHPRIEEIVAYATELRFRHIGLITNGLLLHKREGLLPHLSRLVISLDSLDPKTWNPILGGRPQSAERIIAAVERYADLQKQHRYQLVVNCVVMPDTISQAREVVDFCLRLGAGVSVSPQGLDDQPHEELLHNPEYRALIEDLLEIKKQGGKIVGSKIYLQHMLRFEDFQCYPTLNIRVMPNGDFIYPCRPIADLDDGRGGIAANLLDFEDFRGAFAVARAKYGAPPEGCRSCFQQCFAEPSLLVKSPLSALGEMRNYFEPG